VFSLDGTQLKVQWPSAHLVGTSQTQYRIESHKNVRRRLIADTKFRPINDCWCQYQTLRALRPPCLEDRQCNRHRLVPASCASAPHVPGCPVVPQVARDQALVQQVVERGHRLTGRQAVIRAVALGDGPAKKRLKHVDDAARLAQRIEQLFVRVLLRGAQVVQPLVQAGEALVVRGQHQHVSRHLAADLGERVEPIGHGVGVGLGGVH